jgi:glycine cleavage system regulatory protein
MNSKALVLTCFGEDSEGLVEALARAISAHGGNWLESRMARLGGRFAGILQVDVPAGNEEALRADLAGLDSRGLCVVVEASAEAVHRDNSLELELIGQDHPGIVHEIARVLAANGVNVEELDTGCSNAAESGETLFHARISLHAPDTVDTEKLFRELEAIALDLMVDVVIDAPEEP